ncbi:hypothetical protein C8J57DRAFT_1133335, partial [Mycena rebaudengoi]
MARTSSSFRPSENPGEADRGRLRNCSPSIQMDSQRGISRNIIHFSARCFMSRRHAASRCASQIWTYLDFLQIYLPTGGISRFASICFTGVFTGFQAMHEFQSLHSTSGVKIDEFPVRPFGRGRIG